MSPRTKAREEETGGTEARKRILGAALSAFMEGGYAQTSTLEVATRARVSKRELYALFGNKEAMLVACITERAQRLKAPADLPELRDRETLAKVLIAFGTRLLTETTDPVVVAVFRLAISETVHQQHQRPLALLGDVDVDAVAFDDALRCLAHFSVARRSCSKCR